MGIAHEHGIESTAAIFHHPLHPLAIALPIGTLVFALAADIGFLLSREAFWTNAAFWLLWAGIVTGLGAAGLGAIDYLAITELHKFKTAHLHAAANLSAVAIAVANLVVHWVVGDPLLGWLALALSIASVGALSLGGFLGGMLAYRYRIGQIAQVHGGEIPNPVATAALMRSSHS